MICPQIFLWVGRPLASKNGKFLKMEFSRKLMMMVMIIGLFIHLSKIVKDCQLQSQRGYFSHSTSSIVRLLHLIGFRWFVKCTFDGRWNLSVPRNYPILKIFGTQWKNCPILNIFGTKLKNLPIGSVR